jgi:uncharacterized damage-inducible protein DinB
MRRLAAALLIALPAAASAQAGFMAEMHRDVNEVQKKMIDLANAIPESAYGWRPGPGVRSVGEALLHVASDNYLIPVYMGKPAPAATGITAEFQTAIAYEKRALTKAQIVAELTASYSHLHQAMGLTTDQNLGESMGWFGQSATRQRAMVGTVTHLHEHLGQLIAYARSNGVKPPWSR